MEFSKHWNRNWNRNPMMLESESESESKFLGYTGIGIRIGIACYWNRNWNRNHGFWKTLESESESALMESELESESVVLESFTTLPMTDLSVGYGISRTDGIKTDQCNTSSSSGPTCAAELV